MKRIMNLLLISGLFVFVLAGQVVAGGYDVGDKANGFRLKNVDGTMVSLKNYENAKGFIVIFTCNHCPYAKLYEERIIALNDRYEPKGFPVIAINPNDPELVPEDSFENMQKRAKEKGYDFPYLIDIEQDVYPAYGATRTPHVFVLDREGEDLIVSYIGAIDDNYEDPSAVKVKYVENAVDALLNGEEVETTFTKAIGCTIKDKNKKK